MQDANIKDIPKIYTTLEKESDRIGFTMPSDLYIGSLLKTLISSKPGGSFLELGTGIGLSLSWMLEGMNAESKLVSIDNDELLIGIAQQYFGTDNRLTLVCDDAAVWIKNHKLEKFDLIFADAWPGKYSDIELILGMVAVGGYYVIDDMTKQPNWPEGHEEHVKRLVAFLESREEFNLTKMNWSTGVLIAVRIK